MPASVSLHNATFADLPDAARLLIKAFSTGPIIEWAEPDPTARVGLLEPCFTAMLNHPYSLTRLAHLDGRIVGAALWIPEPTPSVDLDELAADLPPGTAVNRPALLEKTAAQQRPHGIYHHLAYLAVDPHHRQHQIGSYLLSDYLTQLTTNGIPAYLEASNLRNRALYQRHGFTDLGQPLTVDDSPPIWAMWHPAERSPAQAPPPALGPSYERAPQP
ncbi:GNAT family N-acetyltransferase [Actinoplanes sp. Pm04-4]|uniref:GNAT family N-acetyltransferase n=1 Tax=Paractinoplanes pyxinae TaxID=2997416 RepID=A0ABT4B6L4_9ACTN|nr:GNAT family N-acetyltransferase [Actinoplanes pyxinae]MCY1141490.1 GNAT family N-acetyltransferase [Actinoplanes pyxinae]